MIHVERRQTCTTEPNYRLILLTSSAWVPYHPQQCNAFATWTLDIGNLQYLSYTIYEEE